MGSTSVIRYRGGVLANRQVWDVVVGREASATLFPVWLAYYDRETKKEVKVLLCQVQNNERLGWTVVVAGEVKGLRLVAGFKQRWQAIRYALDARTDLDLKHPDAD